VIRQAGEDDLPEILALIRELAEFENLREQVTCTEAELRRNLFGPLPVARASLAVGREDGADTEVVTGMALWFPTFSTFLGTSGIWLEDLYVRRPFRRQGYGRELVEHLRSRTDGRVEWAVLDWNHEAIAFYERLGASPLEGWTTYRIPPVRPAEGAAT